MDSTFVITKEYMTSFENSPILPTRAKRIEYFGTSFFGTGCSNFQSLLKDQIQLLNNSQLNISKSFHTWVVVDQGENSIPTSSYQMYVLYLWLWILDPKTKQIKHQTS